MARYALQHHLGWRTPSRPGPKWDDNCFGFGRFKRKCFLASPLNPNTWHLLLMIDNERKHQNNRFYRTNRVSKMES